MHEIDISTYVCVYDQEHELLTLARGTFSDCRTGRMHEIDVSTHVCVYGQEHELLTLARPVRVSDPDCDMDKQLWESHLSVEDEAEQSIDFKHCKWGFPITAKVRAANCC